MSPSALALIVTALFAAGAGDPEPQPPLTIARAGEPERVALEIQLPPEYWPNPLPPPPTKAVLITNYFGTVTVDHEAHLRRRVHCVDCHDGGRVQKIAFTPKVAHDRCRGCHVAISKGPTDCRGCHLVPPKESHTVAAGPPPAIGPGGRVNLKIAAATPARTQPPSADGAAPPAPVPDPAASPTLAPPPGTAASASFHAANAAAAAAAASALLADPPPTIAEAPAPPAPAPVVEPEPEPTGFARTVQLGAATGTGYGFSARLVSRQGARVLSHSIDRLGGGSSTRTLALFGAGARLPITLPLTLGLFAEGVAGLDAVERPSIGLTPALGVRLGLEWTPAWTNHYPFVLSVTGLVDAFHQGRSSPTSLYAMFGVGAPLQRPAAAR